MNILNTKFIFLVCLLSVIHAFTLVAQDNTPYPEGYLKEATRVDMSKAPNVFVTKNGNEVVTRIVEGRKWNRSWYWDQVRKQSPYMFDGNNNYLIDEGLSPKVNDQFIKHNPQFVKFKGEVLHHHHYRQGNIAYALPKKLHVGKGYTKLWHKFGGKTLVLIGTAFAIYSIGVVGNPFSESPFDTWVQMEADELELSMIEVAMSQGYSATKRYVENCRSCSEIAIYFADYGELIYYIAKGHLPQGQAGELFSGQLPENGSEARYLLNKAVEFGIVFRKADGAYESLGIIDIPNYDE